MSKKSHSPNTRTLVIEQLEPRQMLEAEPFATVEEMRDAMALRYTDTLREFETTALLRDIAGAEGLYPQHVAEQTAAQNAQRLFDAQSWFQRSDFCDPSCKITPNAKLSPALQAQQQMIESAFYWAFLYLDAKAAGKTQDANAYSSYASKGLDRYLRRGTYEYQMAKQYGFYVPRVDAIIWQAQVVRDRQANTRATATAKDAAVVKNIADREDWAGRLQTGNLDLRRQAPALDGNTADEAHIIDGIMEQAMEEGLRNDTDLQALRIRTGARVDLEEGVLQARMTDREFSDLGLQLASAVSASDGSIGQVTDAVHAAILENSTLQDILERSHTTITRYRESPLTAEILEDVETASEIPYARIRVEVLSTGDGDGSTVFSIRLRNPGTQSYITGANIHQLIEHPEGLADGRVDMIMAQPWNFLYKGVQDSEIILYADAQRTKMLDRVLIRYDIRQNIGAVLTEQSDWDDYEEGKLERIPIEPKLMVYGTYKHNVLVALQSPSDQSVVTFGFGGIWETNPLEHDGGTPYAMRAAMFNYTLPSGQYPLYLYDRPNGLLQDTVLFQWDKATQTLTPVDATDGAPEIPEENAAAANELAYFQTAATMEESIFYGEQHWQRILHSEVIERTRDFPAPYNVTHDFYEAFYNVHPELRSENIEATVDAEWAIRGPTWTRKQIRDNVYDRRSDLIRSMNDRCIEYSIALGEILGKAVEGMQRIRRGGDPATAFQSVYTLWEAYENPRNLNGYGYRATCVDIIHDLTGLTLPTPELAIEVARRVIDQIMVRLQEMIVDHTLTVQRLVDSGYHLNGDGNWVPNSTYVSSTFNPDLEHASRIATRFSRWFGEEVAMADPRLDVVAQSDGTMRVVVAALDQHYTEGQTVAEIDRIYDVALDTAVQIEIEGADLLDGIVTSEAMSFIDLRLALDQQNPQDLLSAAIGWYRRAGTTGQYPLYGTEAVRDDTAMGKIFNGLMQQTAVKQGIDLKLVFAVLEQVMGIRAIPLYNFMQANNRDAFYAECKRLFVEKGYGALFVLPTQSVPETPQLSSQDTRIRSVTLDKQAYTDQDARMHVSFDLTGVDTSFSQWNVYLADPNGNPLPDTAALFEKNATGTLSADIPIYRIQEVLTQSSANNTYTLRLAVWKNPTDTAGIPGNFISAPFTFSFTQIVEEPTPLKKLSDDPVENAVLNEVAKNFPLEGDPTTWRWVIGSEYHVDNDFHAADLNFGWGEDDYGKEIKAVADGEIGPIGLDFGSVRILHTKTIDGQKKKWQSIMLHMPIYKTERVAENGNAIYEMRNKDGSVAREIYEGMSVEKGQTYGIVAGRGLLKDGTRSDTAFSPHAHQEIEVEGRSTDLRTTIAAWGITNLKAFDGNAYLEHPVTWDDNAQKWMINDWNIALDRSAQTGTADVPASWVAWHNDATQRMKVKYDQPTGRWYQWDDSSNDYFVNDQGVKREWLSATKTWQYDI